MSFQFTTVALLLTTLSCGAASSENHATTGAEGHGGGVNESETSEPRMTHYGLGDGDSADATLPQVPAGGSSFFYHHPSGARLGNWFVTSEDGTTSDARVDALVPPRADSEWAFHLMSDGEGLNLWAQLDHPQMGAVDLGAFQELAFWARSTEGARELSVALDIHADFSNGAPSDPAQPQERLMLTAEWHHFTVPFSSILGATPLVRSIDFLAVSDGEPFEIWLDDVALICREGC